MTGPGPWVLVVDDEEDIREMVADVLRDVGYSVRAAAHGRAALAEMGRAEGLPCVVLLDMVMPGMDGAQLLQALAESPLLAQIPVVVISGHPERALPRAARVLLKPVYPDVLISTVNEFCGSPPL